MQHRLLKRFLYCGDMPRAVRTHSLPGCQDPSAPIVKPKTLHCLFCDSKWVFKWLYLSSFRATASSRTSSPFSNRQQTLITSTCSGVSMTISGQTGCFNYYSKPIIHMKVQQQNNTSVCFKHTYLYKLLSVIYISTNLISSG